MVKKRVGEAGRAKKSIFFLLFFFSFGAGKPSGFGYSPLGFGKFVRTVFFPLFLPFLVHPHGFAELFQPQPCSHHFAGLKVPQCLP